MLPSPKAYIILIASYGVCPFSSWIRTSLAPRTPPQHNFPSWSTSTCNITLIKNAVKLIVLWSSHLSTLVVVPIHFSLNHLAMPRSYTFLDKKVPSHALSVLITFAGIPSVSSAIPDVSLSIACSFRLVAQYTRSNSVALHFVFDFQYWLSSSALPSASLHWYTYSESLALLTCQFCYYPNSHQLIILNILLVWLWWPRVWSALT